MHFSAHNTSFVSLHAKEVLRLATASIREVEEIRRRAVNQVVEEALKHRCTHFFGLVSHQKYSDREDVLENCSVVEIAKKTAEGAMETSKALQEMANYLLANDQIADEHKVINISVADFKAIT